MLWCLVTYISICIYSIQNNRTKNFCRIFELICLFFLCAKIVCLPVAENVKLYLFVFSALKSLEISRRILMWCLNTYVYIRNICYDSNIFQEFWVNLLVFCKKIVLIIFLLPLDKILTFFVLFIHICIYICIQYRKYFLLPYMLKYVQMYLIDVHLHICNRFVVFICFVFFFARQKILDS